jgi:phage tail tape-measure protein
LASRLHPFGRTKLLKEMGMKQAGVIVLSTALLAGCATSNEYRPAASGTPYVTPRAGQSAAQQSTDTATCDQVAKDQSHRAAETAKGAGVGAAGGALAGAAAGAAIGAATGGDVGKSAGIGAGVGAVGGAAAGGGYKYSKAKDVHNAAFAQCMAARGYSVTY